ncbi:MAG TPA: TIR domain-containing protein [Mycobacterium sp.]|uniref:TIR domain-containing protein n=1 Tax=Mycobacterium sp. TaxID=1785 RepID=UPI002B7FC913|nr:TIR domain-containing protein [Mycobacterium sp.]HME77917.1 TIR domain-containing protein [Mycobacterium sp.]
MGCVPPPLLEEVFNSSGIPTHTFVEPDQWDELVVALRSPGRGVVIEGPTGVGKTTALEKAVDALGSRHAIERWSARIPADCEWIRLLPEMDDAGLVAIDDYNRLPDDLRQAIADRMKILADQESRGTKLIVLGINNAGSSLITFARDLVSRISIVRMGTSTDEKVRKLVTEGSAALNCDLPVEEIVRHSQGSFQMAQVLAHKCCVLSQVTEAQATRKPFTGNFEAVLDAVMNDLALRYAEIAMKFAAGPSFNREGRAPYLHLLKWIAESKERTITLNDQLLNKYPTLRASIATVVSGGHLVDHINSSPDFAELIHFDPRSRFLSIEEPQFHFYLRHLNWSRFAMRVGFVSLDVQDRYDFALSFAADKRDQARYLSNKLKARDLHVFFDMDEQDRILATNIEDYLRPIYKSEATFVVCFLSSDYPKSVWTMFESKQFNARFGRDSVIPVYFDVANKPVIDGANKVGSCRIVESQPIEPQLDDLAEDLCKKIAEMRARPRARAGEFYCVRCSIMYPEKLLAPDRANTCMDCAERERVDA